MLLTGQIDASVKGPERKGGEGPAAPTLRPRWLHAGHAGDTEPLLLPGKAGPSPGSTPTSSGPVQGASWSGRPRTSTWAEKRRWHPLGRTVNTPLLQDL